MQRPSIEDVWPRIRCRTCEAICPLVVVPLVDPLDHDASDLVCGICSSMVATLHGPEARTSPGWQYREMATGHWPMFSLPEQLADLLLELIEVRPSSAAAREIHAPAGHQRG